MTTEEKCESILRLIVEVANKKGYIGFEEDFGGNTLTMVTNQNGHIGSATHIGHPGASFEDLVDGIYNSLVGEPGLTWTKG